MGLDVWILLEHFQQTNTIDDTTGSGHTNNQSHNEKSKHITKNPKLKPENLIHGTWNEAFDHRTKQPNDAILIVASSSRHWQAIAPASKMSLLSKAILLADL